MNRLFSQCPVCHGPMKISSLQCQSCGLELRNDFELSIFDRLNSDQYEFLMTFLKHRGNLKNLQNELQLSYPAAKKKLDEVLFALGFAKEESPKEIQEEIDMRKFVINHKSTKASEIIKAKLVQSGGRVTVYTLQGLPCEVWANANGETFSCDKLPIKPDYSYEVFDVIVDLLLSQNGKARKGNGRNYKMGDPECDESTVVGTVAKYSHKEIGESVYDPVFVLAAILDWAEIAHNNRGELVLTASYRSKL